MVSLGSVVTEVAAAVAVVLVVSVVSVVAAVTAVVAASEVATAAVAGRHALPARELSAFPWLCACFAVGPIVSQLKPI